jgi:hypothetical protein
VLPFIVGIYTRNTYRGTFYFYCGFILIIGNVTY